MSKELENAWAVQEIWQNKCYKLEEENRALGVLNDEIRRANEKIREEIRKLKEKIRFLEQCLDNKEKVNKSLREEISKITMVADDEKQSIEHILELEKENKKLKEERDFFKEQAMLWRKDYTNEYEKNRNMIGKLESLEK